MTTSNLVDNPVWKFYFLLILFIEAAILIQAGLKRRNPIDIFRQKG